MRQPPLVVLAFWSAICVCSLASLANGQVAVWPVNVHAKLLRTDQPPQSVPAGLFLSAARNEYESGQFAVRCNQKLDQLRVTVSELKNDEGVAFPAQNVRVRFVGYIPLESNTPDSEAQRIATAPCEVPDPLLETTEVSLPPDTTQPIWVTVYVPPDLAPGVYRGEIVVHADGRECSLPLQIRVLPFTLPQERHLFVTNWFDLGNIARAHKVELWTEPFWQILERYARNMAEHRQNVVLVPWTLVEALENEDGTLAFDYSRFDRFVETFQNAGVSDRLEIGHVGYAQNGWGNPVVLSQLTAKKRANGKTVRREFDQGLKLLLADLERHLEQKGWLEKAMIHISDEPSIQNVDSWREASAKVHESAPRLRRIDAIETIDFEQALEVWVPKLSQYDVWREVFSPLQSKYEFWYYICCHPYGNIYPNRFLDYPSTAVRVLHWINYVYDLKGYLHWGWNFWGNDPFGVPSDQLPPGDSHVVYPGTNGPLDSIRWEIQRESLEDFEYLCLLEQKIADVRKRLGNAASWIDPRRRSLELAARIVPNLAETTRDSVLLEQVRDQIVEEIVALDQLPIGLVQTEPHDGATLIHGPINLEVRGVVEPGTIVKVNGHPVPVRSDGRFGCRATPRKADGAVLVEIARDGKTKTFLRHFTVRYR